MDLIRQEKSFFYGFYSNVKSNGFKSGDCSFEFRKLNKSSSFLSKYKYLEVFYSFYNFMYTFENIQEDEQSQFIVKNDFILCSILNRVLEVCKNLFCILMFRRGRPHYPNQN